jgi:hypothetical protein
MSECCGLVFGHYTKKAYTCDGLVIISYVGDISHWAQLSWTQRLLGTFIPDPLWPSVRLQNLDKVLSYREKIIE